MIKSDLDRINNADEIVKEILRNWGYLRSTYPDQIKKYKFSEDTKHVLKQIALEFYEKYSKLPFSNQAKVVKNEKFLKLYSSVQIYGKDTNPLFTFPNTFLAADSLNPEIYRTILHNWPISHVDIELFSRIFWRERRKVVARYSNVDLQIIKAFFNFFKDLEVQKRWGYPDTTEFMSSDQIVTQRTIQLRYKRLLNLQILVRRSIINHSKLGLIPLLKVYDPTEVPSKIEKLYSTWYSPLSPTRSIRILVIPEHSSFWYQHSATDVFVLQSRYRGININSFNGNSWKMDIEPKKLVKLLLAPEEKPSPQWKMDFTFSDGFSFTESDLNLLFEYVLTSARRIKDIMPRTGVEDSGYIPLRLKQLLSEEVLQTYFRLDSVGLNEGYSIWVSGTETELQPIYHWICHSPQYFIATAERGLFALIWLSSKLEGRFFEIYSLLKGYLDIQDFCYSPIDQTARSGLPDLLSLWDNKKEMWYSEQE
ncbi:MAG: hypothetical protein ACFFC7_00375 [Candidatus Hermodarchaeota archaeon]